MQIIHKIDNFLFTIFPALAKDHDSIIPTLENYYTYGPFKPKITIDDDIVKIDVDLPEINSQDADYKKMIDLSEKGKYTEAKPILQKLIEKNPTISEYHRILGQILSDQGDQEEAINSLIDALRWDSKNKWALMMMGNIFAKYKDDTETALKYYNQAIVANVQDHISLTNIAFLLMKKNKNEEAKNYLWEAIKINNQFPNTHFLLAIIAEIENDLPSAFFSTVEAIKTNKNRDILYEDSVKKAFEIANRIVSLKQGANIFREYQHKLESETGVKIDIQQDSNIKTAAKIEIAENYNHPTHVLKYKPGHPAVEHLIMHELVHLDFITQARKENSNLLFLSNQEHSKKFKKDFEATSRKMKRAGYSEETINSFCEKIFVGTNLQIYNTPIDLFIENFLYNEYPDLRAFQFLSLYRLIQEGLEAVTNKGVVEIAPKEILSASKIYNLVYGLQFKELYGLDFIKDFKASPSELKLAHDFYNEYLQYRDDKEPAEEYEMLIHWAEDLKLDQYFELSDENDYLNNRTNIENLLSSIEKDPYYMESKDPYKKRQQEKFNKSQEDIGLNMAVVGHMAEALIFFKTFSLNGIKRVAVEIATLGTQGFNPAKTDYRINSIPRKQFTGYQILSYMYVSFALAIPEGVDELGLNYKNEYEMAKEMSDQK